MGIFTGVFWDTIKILFPAAVLGGSFKFLWQAMGEVFNCWMMTWVCSLLRVMLELVVAFLAPLFATLPQMPVLDLAPIIQWWMLFDYYFPLTYTLTWLAILFPVVISFRVYRLVKSNVPSLSN